MDPNLIIDDEYIFAVGDDCKRRGIKLEEALEQYLEILKEIQTEALVEGNVAEALVAFIGCVELLKGQLEDISKTMYNRSYSFIQDVNDADQYLF